jgi:chlorite dismutase
MHTGKIRKQSLEERFVMSEVSSAPAAHGEGTPSGRQMVHFCFYKLDPAFRRLGEQEKLAARQEFVTLAQQRHEGMICLTYSTVGLRGDTDLLLWRIAQSSDALQAQTAAFNKSRLGGYLNLSQSFLSMTKRSVYMDPQDPHHDPESRSRILPGKCKYLFVYPFVKTRAWYLLPLEERQKIMGEHIHMGKQYPSVKLNTTYSFGLDDQDFVVAFETDRPADFLDLVMELRETQSSKYTQRDTPVLTCVQMPMEEILGQLF